LPETREALKMPDLPSAISPFLIYFFVILFGLLVLSWIFRKWQSYRAVRRKEQLVEEIRSYAVSGEDEEEPEKGSFFTLFKKAAVLSLLAAGIFCLVPKQTIDALFARLSSVTVFFHTGDQQSSKAGRVAENEERKGAGKEYSFTAQDLVQAGKRVLAKKQEEMAAVENSAGPATAAPGLERWYEIEFVSGGSIVTKNAEIGDDFVTVVDAKGTTMTIANGQIKTIRQFLR
jgi:hypothetical protein